MKTHEELAKVYKSGMNIYGLLHRLKKQRGWKKEDMLPDSVVLGVCNQYFKAKSIKNQWAWFIKVLDLELSKYFANNEIARNEKTGQMADKIRDLITDIAKEKHDK